MNLAHTSKNKTVAISVCNSNRISSRIKLTLKLTKKREAQGIFEPTICVAYLGKNSIIAGTFAEVSTEATQTLSQGRSYRAQRNARLGSMTYYLCALAIKQALGNTCK